MGITDKETDIGTITLLGGDSDNDGRVKIFDFYRLYFAFRDGIYDPEVDFDKDNDNDVFDFRVVYNNFFRGKKGIASLAKPSGSSIILKASSYKPRKKEQFTVRLKIEGMVDIVGIETYLSFDPSIVEIVSVEERLFDWQATDVRNGEIGIASGISLGKMPISGSSREVVIKFKAVKEGKTRIFVKEGIGIDSNGKAILLQSEPIEIEVKRLIPSASLLGQSFPNPSIDSCWIPFQLSMDSDECIVDIYNIIGQKVKTIDIGPREAGYYTEAKQGSAIFWDLRNDRGDRVATGLYFYRLKAGEFSDTKALVVK